MKKKLIFISLDTVRADVAYSGKFGGVNKLRKDGITFLNTISSSPLTPVSHATVLTGLQPYNHGIRHLFKEKLNPKVETITQILKRYNYKTGAIVSCPGMNKWYDFCRGFDSYDDEIPRLVDGSDPLKTVDVRKRGTALKRGEIVAERACKWIDKNKNEDFFLFLNLLNIDYEKNKYNGISLLPLINNNKKLNLLGYSETFYPTEQTRAGSGKFNNIRNKKSFRINNKYKIITEIDSDKIEFYDLENDENELNNLNKNYFEI